MGNLSSQEKRVLVVCTGNTCRSPMAEGWLKQKLSGKGWRVESAGVAAWGGEPASPEAVEAMRGVGIDISGHRSQALSNSLVGGANYILAMTEGHRREVVRRWPEAGAKTFLVHDFGLGESRDVGDPAGYPVEVYQHTRDELVHALGEFLLYLVEKGELSKGH